MSPSEYYGFSGKGEKVVGCIYTASSTKVERYFLHALLLHKTRAKLFVDMRNVSGVVCVTYREVCQKRGFLIDDAECRRAHGDGFESFFQPFTELFSLIISHCQPMDPKTLFFIHKDSVIAVFRNRFRNHSEPRTEELRFHYIYAEVQQSLKDSGFSRNEQFGLPSADPNLPPFLEQTQEDVPTELQRKAEEAISKFNKKQQEFLNEIAESVFRVVSSTNLDAEPVPQRANMPLSFFVDAPVGTGQTFVTSALH